MRFMQWMELGWGMSMIECCSDIFPIPLNPTKVCLRLIVVSRLTKWMIGMFGIHSTGLTWPVLGWLLACQLGTRYSAHHCLVFPSCPLIICWKAISDNLLYGNIMESITLQDRWQLLLLRWWYCRSGLAFSIYNCRAPPRKMLTGPEQAASTPTNRQIYWRGELS